METLHQTFKTGRETAPVSDVSHDYFDERLETDLDLAEKVVDFFVLYMEVFLLLIPLLLGLCFCLCFWNFMTYHFNNEYHVDLDEVPGLGSRRGGMTSLAGGGREGSGLMGRLESARGSLSLACRKFRLNSAPAVIHV